MAAQIHNLQILSHVFHFSFQSLCGALGDASRSTWCSAEHSLGISELEDVEYFKYLGSILTNDGRCTCEIKCRIAMAKVAFNKKRALFTSTLDLELRKKLVKCYICSIALYSAETWTLRAADQKHLESFEMWCWRRMERSVGLIM